MDVVEMVLGGLVNKDIVTLLNQHGGRAIGLTGKDGSFIRARKLLVTNGQKSDELVDLGQVGEVESIDPQIVSLLETGEFIPVVAPIGVGADGRSYNINADLVAGKLAEIRRGGGAEKLGCSQHPGALYKDGKLLTGLTHEADRRIGSPTAPVRRHAPKTPRPPMRPRVASRASHHRLSAWNTRCCWKCSTRRRVARSSQPFDDG
jgi:acetylglutamate kinase